MNARLITRHSTRRQVATPDALSHAVARGQTASFLTACRTRDVSHRIRGLVLIALASHVATSSEAFADAVFKTAGLSAYQEIRGYLGAEYGSNDVRKHFTEPPDSLQSTNNSNSHINTVFTSSFAEMELGGVNDHAFASVRLHSEGAARTDALIEGDQPHAYAYGYSWINFSLDQAQEFHASGTTQASTDQSHYLSDSEAYLQNADTGEMVFFAGGRIENGVFLAGDLNTNGVVRSENRLSWDLHGTLEPGNYYLHSWGRGYTNLSAEHFTGSTSASSDVTLVLQSLQTVPLPTTAGLTLIGVVSIVGIRRRRATI